MEGHFSASNWISRDKGWKLFLLPVQRPSHPFQTQTQANGRASNSLTRIMSSEERFKDSRASMQLTGVRKDKSVDQTGCRSATWRRRWSQTEWKFAPSKHLNGKQEFMYHAEKTISQVHTMKKIDEIHQKLALQVQEERPTCKLYSCAQTSKCRLGNENPTRGSTVYEQRDHKKTNQG